VVAVADEVQVPDLVDLDRGEDGACPAGPIQCFPSLAVDRSTWAKPPVEVAHATDAADDGIDVEVVESEAQAAGFGAAGPLTRCGTAPLRGVNRRTVPAARDDVVRNAPQPGVGGVSRAARPQRAGRAGLPVPLGDED
jgi:hypothetical protein